MTDIIENALSTPFDINISIEKCRKAFATQKTKTLEWRQQQLGNLLRGIEEMKDELTSAVEKDLGREKFITELTSVNVTYWDTKYHLKHVHEVIARAHLLVH